MDCRSFRKAVAGWYRRGARDFPWRQTGITPLAGLLTEVLLRKTTAVQVQGVYEGFLQLLTREPVDLHHDLSLVLKPLGLQNQRSNAIASIVEAIPGGLANQQVPEDLASLLSLPHTGPYIANATRCFYFGRPAPIVDSNIARLLSRFFGLRVDTENPVRMKVIWLLAAALVDYVSPKEYNWGLLDLSALVCKPRNQDCEACPLENGCALAGSPRWEGLDGAEKRSIASQFWTGEGIGVRFAELAGLAKVPTQERMSAMARKHGVSLEEGGTVSEVALRELVSKAYCGNLVEASKWTYSF